MSKLPEVLGTLIADGLGAIGVPGASTAGEAVKAYLQRRSDEAKEILFEEFRRGEIDAAEVAAEDDRVAVVCRYLRASWEGGARIRRHATVLRASRSKPDPFREGTASCALGF
jgi:hypothetical protein